MASDSFDLIVIGSGPAGEKGAAQAAYFGKRVAALVKGPASIARYLATVGEATEVPRRSPGRGPPYWKSRVLRLKVLGDEDEGGGRGRGAEEVA
jgi:succinate dehydrogenase/fumarate reductase flavoprotein subunit